MEDSNTVKKAMEHVESLGVPMPKKPGRSADDIEWPATVGELSLADLSRHITWWTGWEAYIGPEVAKAATNATAYEKELGLALSIEMHKRIKEFDKVTDRKAAVMGQKYMQELEARFLEAKAHKTLLASIMDGYGKKAATVSREITVRGEQYSGSRRS